MLTADDRERIEDATGITPDQLRRLERMGADVVLPPTAGSILAAALEQQVRDRRLFGCLSEAH